MQTDRKALIRRDLIARRAAVSTQERVEWSERIQARLLTLPLWRQAQRVLAYCSMPKEVQTSGILEAALRDGKRLFLPRCRPGLAHFETVEVRNLPTDLEPGPLRNLMQPLASLPTVSAENGFDLVLAPGVAFDRQGYRIGFGAGMYDRFFDANPLPHRLALAFCFQVVDRIPVAPHDLPVHGILTEEGLIEVPLAATDLSNA